MQIPTEFGNIDVLYGTYSGIFDEQQSYATNSFTYIFPQFLTIIYSPVNNGYLGDISLENGAKITITYDSRVYVKIYDKDEVLIRNYDTGLYPTVGNNFHLSFAIIEDSEGKYIFYPFTPNTNVGGAYSEVVPASQSGFGTCQMNRVSFYYGGITYNESINNILHDKSVPDPYSPGGNTEPGGGEGDHDDTEDDVDFPSSPTLNALSAKFISIYTPTTQQLDDLASFMWSGPFDPNTFKKIFGNPMQAILGLSIVPVAVPIPVGPPPALTLGNVNTGVGVNQASEQYIEVDCGSLSVEEYWGSYLDYEPYTRTEIYLPYIGVRNISTDDVMGKTIAVKYKVDILSGACIALLKCDNTILYSFNGVCAVSIPITGNDWTNVISGSISAAISSVGIIAGTVTGAAPLTAASAVSALSSASQNVMQMKPYVDKSGALGGNAGMLGVQYPYLIITRPRQALPENQNHYTGYPSFITSVLGDLSGMTYVDHVHLENIPCTSAEQIEIESLLKGGVIF